jgi:2-keto-3-deoxy-L-rhamnonate aldolase RhmA
LLIGSSDLSLELGIPGQYAHRQLDEAYRHVIAACSSHGKSPGMAGVTDPELMAKNIALGMRFILSGSDLGFILAGGRERTRYLRHVDLK